MMFGKIEKETIDKAIIEMCEKLKISGSIAGRYDLYSAIYGEWEKAKHNPYTTKKDQK